MSDRTVLLSELVNNNVLEIGAGRPRSAGLDRFPLPILRVADVLEGRIRPSVHESMPILGPQEKGPKISRPGDVVLTAKGTVGRVAIMLSEGPTFAYSPQLYYFRSVANGSLMSRYLYYWFKSEEFWSQADALKGQTDMADFLSLSDVHSLKVRVPSLKEQAGVVDVLGSLDDKIAANERILSSTDEYLSCEFARLCTGAKFDTLRNIAVVNASIARPVIDGELRYLDISAVSAGAYEIPAVTKWEEAPGRARRALKAGDTVWSTVRPNRRSHALILDGDPLLVGSTGLAVLSPNKGRIACTYESARRDEFVQYLESVADGSAYPAVRADRFNEAPVPALRDEQWDHFESIALPLRRRSHAAIVENRSLAATRNELLPLLMSGKVRVPDAEKIVEGVV